MVKEHNQIVVVVMGILDLAITAAVWLGCYYVRFHSGWFALRGEPVPLRSIADLLVITLLLAVLLFGRMGLYRPRRRQSPTAEALDVLRACVVVWAAQILAASFLHNPRVSLKFQVLFLACWPVAMIVYRGTARLGLRALRQRGRNLRTVAIIGAGRSAQKLFHTLRRQSWSGYEILYFVEDRRVGGQLLGVPVRGPIDRLDAILDEHPADCAFVALPEARNRELAGILDRLANRLIDVNVVPDLLSYHFLQHEVERIGSLPVVNLTYSPQTGWNAALKRLFDVVGAVAALLISSPLLLVIAAAVKLTSKGPALYRQRRTSLGGKEFEMMKFRSMTTGADRANGHQWSTDPSDPRITAVGRVIRKLSLDELPQLFNVLTGEMSLVGPRPEQPRFIERFSRQVPRYALRHHVKAGITGWAQVCGYRGRTSLRKRIQCDLYYINRWSFQFDVWILVLTVFRGFVHPSE